MLLVNLEKEEEGRVTVHNDQKRVLLYLGPFPNSTMAGSIYAEL